MTIAIHLYTTAGCHLCEQAAGMLNYLLQSDSELAIRFSIRPVEISESNDLLEKYGVRIPVLQVGSHELSWPFELDELNTWLNQNTLIGE